MNDLGIQLQAIANEIPMLKRKNDDMVLPPARGTTERERARGREGAEGRGIQTRDCVECAAL